MDTAEIVRDYYNHSVQMEWERLGQHGIEFAVTKHFLDRYCKPKERVLDIGGGPGRYTLYLAEKECNVTLYDLSEENVAFAVHAAEERQLHIEAVQGDAREVDRKVGGMFDHILLMGPLYHLLEEEERAKAVEAALKLLKPGGLLYVSFISLYAGFSEYMKNDPRLVMSESEQEYIRCYLENKTYSGDAFTKAFLLAPKDIDPFMQRFPLQKLHLFGQEGITSIGENNITACAPDVVERWIELAIATCEREEFAPFSEHLMYIGRKTERDCKACNA